MSDGGPEFARHVDCLDAVESIQTGGAVHVYAADQTPERSGQTERVRLVTPAPQTSDKTYERVVDGLTAWRALSSQQGITTVRDSGETPRPWVAVTAEGRSLAQTAPLSAEQTRTTVAAVAEAVRHAETEGYETLPFGPGNVRINTAGEPTATLDWPVSPGSGQSPYSASDGDAVFCLGAVTYYALTGNDPAPAESTETATTSQGWAAPSTRISDLPAAFDSVIDQATHPDPAQRHDSVYELKRAVLFETTHNPETGVDHGVRESMVDEESAWTDDESGENDEQSARIDDESSSGGVSRRAVLGAVSAGVAATTVGGTWVATTQVFGSPDEQFPMFRYDAANTGYISGGTGPTEGVTAAWEFEGGESVVSSPVVADGSVLLNNRAGKLYALDALDGTEHWARRINRPVPLSATIGEEGVFLVERDEQNSSVTARNLTDGSRQWRKGVEASDPRARPGPLADGRLYTLGSGGIYVHDTETGDEQWLTDDVAVSSLTAAYSDGTLYFGGVMGEEPDSSNDQGFVAFDTTTQRIEWTAAINGFLTSSPAVVDGVVYVGGQRGFVYAFDAEDGSVLWRYRTDGPVQSSPAVTDHNGGTLYIGSTDTRLYALNTEDGTERWQFETDGSIISSPAVVSDTVYVGGQDGFVYAVSANNGDLRWKFETDGSIVSSPAVVSNRLFIGTENGTIYGLTEP